MSKYYHQSVHVVVKRRSWVFHKEAVTGKCRSRAITMEYLFEVHGLFVVVANGTVLCHTVGGHNTCLYFWPPFLQLIQVKIVSLKTYSLCVGNQGNLNLAF
jgi:hypothetical protein